MTQRICDILAFAAFTVALAIGLLAMCAGVWIIS